MNNNYDIFFVLNLLANLAQLYDLQLNMSETPNNTLNEKLNEIIKENEKILNNQEEILRLLKGE